MMARPLGDFLSAPSFDEGTLLARDPAWPSIAVVTPSFNQAEFLERTMLSVLNQNYPNLQYVVVDGGSTDGSVEVIKKYEKYLAGWVSEPDGGQAAALNKGYAMCDGDIRGWQNSDDVYLPGAFHTVADSFRAHPETDYLFGNIKYIDAGDREIGELRFVPLWRVALLYEGGVLSNQASFWRRELQQRAGGFDPSIRFCMDFEFFVRASEHGRFRHLRRFLGAYRNHEATKTSTIHEVGYEEHEAIAERHGVPRDGSLRRRAVKLAITMRRTLLYPLQGDADYVLRGVRRRGGALARRLVARGVDPR